MNSAEIIETHLEELIQAGKSKPEIIREIGPACVEWPYVFGAWGEICSPQGRNNRKRSDHPTIVTACQVLNGTKSSCSGCKWDLPVRMFDCRGWTHWLLGLVGITISGGGCTTQWNTKSNWTEQGLIADMPRDKVCCIFTGDSRTKEHTGMYLGDGSTVECSSGVQYFSKMKSKWKYYAIPAGLYGDEPMPTDKPTIRKGDSGPYVTLAQTELINRGYDLAPYGADGKFGAKTETAVKAFQRDWDLKQDGIIGPKTWKMLESTPVVKTYTVHIPHVPEAQADAMITANPGAWKTLEGSDTDA